MKNRFIYIIFFILLNLNSYKFALAEEFIFEVSNLEITNKGNTYKGKNRGKITSNTQLELVSDYFEYSKQTNQLEVNGNVQVVDVKNNITINAEKIFYFKKEEKISTQGKTLINISNKYKIEGYDLTLLNNKMILSSNKNTIITDNDSNIYRLDSFQYLINQEILKGKNINVSTSKDNKISNNNFFLKQDFSTLKKINS